MMHGHVDVMLINVNERIPAQAAVRDCLYAFMCKLGGGEGGLMYEGRGEGVDEEVSYKEEDIRTDGINMC